MFKNKSFFNFKIFNSCFKTTVRKFKRYIKIPQKSRNYEICDSTYVGQICWSVSTCFKEHLTYLRHGRIKKSSKDQHAIENSVKIGISRLKLRKRVVNNKKLNAAEWLEIRNYKNKRNSDLGPVPMESSSTGLIFNSQSLLVMVKTPVCKIFNYPYFLAKYIGHVFQLLLLLRKF